MNSRMLSLCAAMALVALAPRALAEDPNETKAPSGRLIHFGDETAAFTVTRDARAGTATFALTDPSVRLAGAPTLVVTTDNGPRTLTLEPVAGKTGVWRLSDDVVKADTIDATMHIMVSGRTYAAALPTTWKTIETVPGMTVGPKWVAMHGGRVVELVECNTAVEIVQQPSTGTLTVWAVDGATLAEAPVITITEKGAPETLTLTKVEGQSGAWSVTKDIFKTEGADARIRVNLKGKPCEAPLLGANLASHGGEIVVIEGGPRFEVVRDPSGVYAFYALDEKLSGKTYVIESPSVVLNVSGETKTYALTPISGQPRAWRLAGLDSSTNAAIDGHLKFTISGQQYDTRLHLIERERVK